MLTVIRPRFTRPITGTPLTAAMVSAFATANAPSLTAIGSGQWPTTLPAANRQPPEYGTFDAQMRAAAKGTVLTDPVFGSRHLKLTNTGTATVEYGAPNATMSHRWIGSDGLEKITVAYMLNGAPMFEDVTLSTLTSANLRSCPGQLSQQGWHFSRNPATPRIGYYLKQNPSTFAYDIIQRYDTATGLAAPLGNHPAGGKDFSSLATNPFNFRIQSDDAERWFAFHTGPTGAQYAIAWDTQTNTMYRKTQVEMQATRQPNIGLGSPPLGAITSFNECTLQRDGAMISLQCLAGTPPAGLIWNLATQTMADVMNAVAFSHQDSCGSLHFQAGLKTYDWTTNIETSRYTSTEVLDSQYHSSGLWLQPGVPILDQWVQPIPFSSGQPVNVIPGRNGAASWAIESGSALVDAIYRVDPAWFAGSGQTDARMASGGVVLQATTGDENIWRGRLTKVLSLGAIVAPGQWVMNTANGLLYQRPLGDIAPDGFIAIVNPPACYDAVPLVRMGGTASTGGKAVHGFFHPYSNLIWWEANNRYTHMPTSQISQCGRYALYKTNQGNRAANAATNVYFVAPPVGQG